MPVAVERRRHARYPFERNLEVRVPPRRATLMVRALDISQSGFSFFTDCELQIGEHLVLTLRSDDDFFVEAEVRHVRSAGDAWVIGAERVERDQSS